MESLLNFYTNKITDLNKQIEVQKSKTNRIFYSRLFLFIAALGLFFYFIGNHNTTATITAIITIITFLILLRLEITISRKITFLQNLIKVNEIEIDLLKGNYEKLNEGKEFIDKHHNFIADLDIFGRRSIFQILNRTSTYSGRIKLAGWLTMPFLDGNEIVKRQDAVKDLSGKPEWCQHFIALGITNKEEAADKDAIQDWLNEANYFSNTFLKVVSALLPLLTIIALGLYSFNFTSSSAFTILFFVQLLIVGSHTKKVNQIHNQLSRKFDSIEKYRSLISLIESEQFNSSELNSLKDNFKNSKEGASKDIQKLKKHVDTLDARMNIVVALLLNGILLWDINVMRNIEKWKNEHKSNFLKWIDIIGEFDAFISIGLYGYNNSNYTYPKIYTNSFVLETEDIGHPLINKKGYLPLLLYP